MASSSPEPEEEVITVEDDSPDDRRGIHCSATWKIGNFGCCQLECGEEFSTPFFSADSSGRVKWYLSIFPNGQPDFEEYVSVHVIFMRSDKTRVDSLRASCKVSIIDSEAKVWASERVEQNLTRIHFDAFVKRKTLLEARDTVIPHDTLTVRCQISAFDPAASVKTGLDEAHDEHLRALADDFGRLYESGKFCDVTLEAKDGNISAHKAILAARSSVFADHFREPQPTYPVSDFDKEGMGALMSYIYTGQVDTAAPALSLDLHEMAEAYGLRELAGALAPNEVSAQTEVTNDVFTYTWPLRNFRGTAGRRYSETFHTGPSSTAWALSLSLRKVPGNDGDDRQLSVYLHKLPSANDEKALYVRFSVSLLDRERRPRHTAHAERLYKLSDRCGVPVLVTRSVLLEQAEDFLPADTLTIRCEMRICDGASSSRVQHFFQSRGPSAGDPAILSACLRRLLRGGRGCDVTVCATDREFRLHRPVLCARSEVFADFFARYGNGLSNYTINIQGIRPQVLELLFEFLYTGRLVEGAPSCQTAPGLFAAAEHYRVPGLKRLCADFMRANACEVLVSVDRGTDARMRDLVRDFVCENAEEVLVSERWPQFAKDHPRLASEVLKSLARGYREAKKRRLE